MRHADLIDVRKTHGKTDLIFRVFPYDIYLMANISNRLLDLQ